MTERELRDWQLFETCHQPLPDKLADLHSALLCSIVVNLARSSGSMPAELGDFFVIREPKPRPPDDGPSEAERQMRNWRGG